MTNWAERVLQYISWSDIPDWLKKILMKNQKSLGEHLLWLSVWNDKHFIRKLNLLESHLWNIEFKFNIRWRSLSCFWKKHDDSAKSSLIKDTRILHFIPNSDLPEIIIWKEVYVNLPWNHDLMLSGKLITSWNSAILLLTPKLVVRRKSDRLELIKESTFLSSGMDIDTSKIDDDDILQRIRLWKKKENDNETTNWYIHDISMEWISIYVDPFSTDAFNLLRYKQVKKVSFDMNWRPIRFLVKVRSWRLLNSANWKVYCLGCKIVWVQRNSQEISVSEYINWLSEKFINYFTFWSIWLSWYNCKPNTCEKLTCLWCSVLTKFKK